MNLFEIVTCKTTKPRLSGNMLPNRNSCENGWANFSANMRDVAIKLFWLTQLESQNLLIYFNFVLVLGSVVMLIFLNFPPERSPLVEKSFNKLQYVSSVSMANIKLFYNSTKHDTVY